jgi:hypothetical protein
MNELLQKLPFLPADKSMPSLMAWGRGEMKKSRFKIWLRAFLFVQFSTIFSIYFFRDIAAGHFRWEWVALIYLTCLPIGFLMSRIVPMRADAETRAVLLSIDVVYLVLIWVLVIAKLIASLFPNWVFLADICMAVILGVMSGRLSGICLRVRRLKLAAGFLSN